MEHQLYAKIKKSSKYFYQNGWAKENDAFPFKVHIEPDPAGYCVVGGPGGRYCLSDVNLFVVEHGCEIKLGR